MALDDRSTPRATETSQQNMPRTGIRRTSSVPVAHGVRLHPALLEISDFIENLEVELDKIKRKAVDEQNQAREEIRHLREMVQKHVSEVEHLERSHNLLERQVEDRDGRLSEERQKVAERDKLIQVLTKDLREERAKASSLEEKLDQAVKKREETRAEVERLQASKSRLESRLEDREQSLEEGRRKSEELEKLTRRLERDLGEAKSKTTLLDDRFEQASIIHREEVGRLQQKVIQEAKSEVRTYQNQIESSLITEFVDFQRSFSLPMTVELGENLRVQLRRIFTRMTELGIDFSRQQRR